jgi:hypothetical protein
MKEMKVFNSKVVPSFLLIKSRDLGHKDLHEKKEDILFLSLTN